MAWGLNSAVLPLTLVLHRAAGCRNPGAKVGLGSLTLLGRPRCDPGLHARVAAVLIDVLGDGLPQLFVTDPRHQGNVSRVDGRTATTSEGSARPMRRATTWTRQGRAHRVHLGWQRPGDEEEART